MKATKQILMLLLGGFIAIPAWAQDKSSQNEIKRLAESKEYKIDVNTALPMRGRNIPLTSRYSLEIKNDSVISQLPYFGRGYNVPYGGGEGLNFEAPIEEYTVKTDKKGNTQVRFSTRSREDVLDYRIKIFENGSSTIDVSMQNRQGISFIGELEQETEK